MALISGGPYCLPPASTRAWPFGPETTLYGTIDSSVFTSASLRPMKRLIEKTVFCGLVTACRLATVPTRRSPDCVNATTDGVVRPPSAFSTTVGSPPSSTAMHELVVPRSIPIVFPIGVLLLFVLENLSVRVADLGGRQATLAARWVAGRVVRGSTAPEGGQSRSASPKNSQPAPPPPSGREFLHIRPRAGGEFIFSRPWAESRRTRARGCGEC